MAINKGNGIVIVEKGDSLWKIATEYHTKYGYSNTSSYVTRLKEINGLTSSNLIVVGQELKLTLSDDTIIENKPVSNNATRVTVTHFGLVSTSNDELFVSWKWGRESETEKYIVRWYRSWDLKGIAPYTDHEVTQTYDSYTPPSEVINSFAGKVSVAIKPVAKIKDTIENSDGSTSDVPYFTSDFSTVTDKLIFYYNKRAPSDIPDAPSVEIKDVTLTATLDSVPDEYPKVEFEIIKTTTPTDALEPRKSAVCNVIAGTASYSATVDLGHTYKVRCRYVNDLGSGEWSAWSGEGGTKPSTSSEITSYRAVTKTEIYLEWTAVANADSYDIAYTTNKRYFEGSDEYDISSDVRTISAIESTRYYLSGLETGDEYFIRVRAVNDHGTSGWSEYVSVVIGTKPTAPTTWSSTTTVIIGEDVIFHWQHNSEDGSKQSKAELEITYNGKTTIHTIETPDSEEDEDEDKLMHHALSTSGASEGATVLWRVRTAGATGEFGDWSIQRTVTIYAPATLFVNLYNHLNNVVTGFPLNIVANAGPSTQKPVAYHVAVYATEYYETTNEFGNKVTINNGDELYSKYFELSDHDLLVRLYPKDLDLNNNMSYRVTVTVSMDSGLTAQDHVTFRVEWLDELYEPNAEIFYDKSTYSMLIRPYCTDLLGALVDNVSISVYRREYNGTFTEIIKDVDNTRQSYITDPHPSLDYARYRIVAVSNKTGAISYTDLPAYYIGESAIIIQWDDIWRTFDNSDELSMTPPWSGSLLRLQYNIDVSEDFEKDVSFVNYVGREHPVSYYGTHRGETTVWNAEIPKSDKDTLYGLRRLASWMGNVYVREPSGIGYWAAVRPSFNQNHRSLVIPITLSITRVEGGA